ncbi:hypothetical protein CHS0354_031312 [Potamilus streckersoni]|uniref:Uncharacterized protein n=1 Tax=Potamilus streckersoni TaxID=2493646 RepID=A0AAE0TCQ0_9BIVA|nr:hypothetical protein CHS0354_031312 [Potamilus streckersoni]
MAPNGYFFSSDSCEDIYKNNIQSPNGVYTIYNRNNQPYQVYCEFHKAYGYTFVATNTSVAVNMDDLHTSSDHVLVRFLRNNHAQTQTKVEQLSSFKSRYQLSLQYSKNDGYATPLNANLGPYLYLGFLPASEASHTGPMVWITHSRIVMECRIATLLSYSTRTTDLTMTTTKPAVILH